MSGVIWWKTTVTTGVFSVAGNGLNGLLAYGLCGVSVVLTLAIVRSTRKCDCLPSL
jgi:hypothetical protein